MNLLVVKETKWFLFLILLLTAITSSYAQECGAVQTLTSSQKTQVKTLFAQLDSALARENFVAIDSLNILIKKTFGTEGGKPDAAERYFNLVSTTSWLDIPSAIELSRKLVASDSAIYSNLWKLGKGTSPPS